LGEEESNHHHDYLMIRFIRLLNSSFVFRRTRYRSLYKVLSSMVIKKIFRKTQARLAMGSLVVFYWQVDLHDIENACITTVVEQIEDALLKIA
jgi:hypothetical protein